MKERLEPLEPFSYQYDKTQPEKNMGQGTAAAPPADWSRTKTFVIRNFLVLGVIVSVAIAFAWPAAGILFDGPRIGPFKIVQTLNVVVIFVISGLTLRTSDVEAATSGEGRKGFFFGIIDILLLTSLSGFVCVHIPFSPVEFAYGLAVFCVVPTTLSAGVTLVALANGNEALALLLTVSSNMLGVVTVPFLLQAILSGASVHINALDLLIKLSATVLVPILLGKAVRSAVPAVAEWTARNKTPLSLTSSTMLLMIFWLGFSTAAEDIEQTSFANISAVVIAGIVLHAVFLAFNYPAAKMLNLPPRELKALVIMASEKAPPIALTVVAYLTDLGNPGLMAVPIITAQIAQVFMDSALASHWGAEAALAAERHMPAAPDAASASAAASGEGREAGLGHVGEEESGLLLPEKPRLG